MPDERQIVGREFVVASCDAPTMLDLVEEPLDAIARTIEVGTEADGLSAIALRRDVGPRSLQLARKAPSRASYGLVAAVGNAGGMLVNAHH